jgi:uncharacterized protein YhfF
MRTVFDRTNPADVQCQRLSQGRSLPTNTRDPPSLINNNELRATFSSTRFGSATRIGNWFEQNVMESGCKQGASPAIASFDRDGPFQRPGEKTLFYNKQGKYSSEYTHRFVPNGEYVGPSREAKQSSLTCTKAAIQSNPQMDFNTLNASEGPAGQSYQYWKAVKNTSAEKHPDEDEDFYQTSSADIGSGKQRRYLYNVHNSQLLWHRSFCVAVKLLYSIAPVSVSIVHDRAVMF